MKSLSESKELIVAGNVILLDSEDYETYKNVALTITGAIGNRYVVIAKRLNRKRKNVSLHRDIMGVTDKSLVVDHINGDTFDNRRVNLRVCTHSENMRNRVKSSNNTSGYKGVSFVKAKAHYKPWRAFITDTNKKKIHLGYYATKEEAAEAYNARAVIYHGEFANLNDIKYGKNVQSQ